MRKFSRKEIKYSLFSFLAMYLLIWNPVFASTVTNKMKTKLNNLWHEYWYYVAIFVALGVLTGVLAMVVLFIRLGANATNPQERSRIVKEMIGVLCTTAALGGITLLITLYFALFN